MGPLLEVQNVSKSFPGVKALDDISLTLAAGQVHALVGENGAGKSTLISILTGAQRSDAGRILMDGRPVSMASPEAARRHGVLAIFQELSIQPWLDVTANIVLGNEPVRRRTGFILDNGAAKRIAAGVLERLGADSIPLNALASRLSPGQKQLVEIARVLALDPPVIIMDEPTSSLPSRDAKRLLEVIDELRQGGKAVLFVSHRLDEVMNIADKVTVLRGGQLVLTASIQDVTPNTMIEAMIGRKIDHLFPQKTGTSSPDVLLRINALSRGKAFHDISFDLRRGEVLGFYGLIGAGRTEVMRAISGADDFDTGEIILDHKALHIRSPNDAIRSGIVYLPEDRKNHGLVLQMSGRENIVLSTLKRLSFCGFIRRRRVKTLTRKLAERTSVRGSLDLPVATLSGGNQQKIVIAKGLTSQARVLIFDEPTRGIDVGAKYEIYVLMRKLASQGVGIILVSSELPEIINLSDRAIVMSGGRIAGAFDRGAFDEHSMLSAAFTTFLAQ